MMLTASDVRVYTVASCQPCVTVKQRLAMIPGVQVREIDDAAGKYRAHPTLEMDGRRNFVGAGTVEQLRAWIEGK